MTTDVWLACIHGLIGVCTFFILTTLNGILQQLKELNAKADLTIWKDASYGKAKGWIRTCLHPDHKAAEVKPRYEGPGSASSPPPPGT